MKNEQAIEILSETYFPFSFYLLEDELQALQLVVDVTTAIMIEHPNLVGEIHKLENQALIYKKIFSLALKRKSQINLDETQISIREKAAFYLSEYVGLSFAVVALMLEIEEIELTQIISSARYKVFLRERNQQGYVSAN